MDGLFRYINYLSKLHTILATMSVRVSVLVSVCLSVCLSAKKNFSSKMDQICKFGEQTSRILEFKPEGLDF